MRRHLLLVLALISTLAAYSGHHVTIIDKSDRTPVVRASVISSKGKIIGFSDTKGKIKISETDWPVSFHSLGYEPVTVAVPSDSIFMKPASYPLAEVVVTPGERPITRVLAYAREYANATFNADTVLIYQEFMVEYFFAEGKVKGYRKSDADGRIRNELSYSQGLYEDGTDTVRQHEAREVYTVFVPKVPDYAIVSFGKTDETEALKKGALTDTIMGKYSPEWILHKRNGIVNMFHDLMARYDGHKWENPILKLMGVNSEIDTNEVEFNYRLNETGEYDHYDLISTSYRTGLSSSGRLKWSKMKEPIDMRVDGFIETFPVLIENITIPEYKEMRKAAKTEKIEFRKPSNLPPMPPAIERLKERGDNIYR